MFRLKRFLVRCVYIFHGRTISTKYRSLRGDGVFIAPCHELFNRYANFKEHVLKRVYRILDSLPRVIRAEHFSQLLIIREINRISIVRVSHPQVKKCCIARRRVSYLLRLTHFLFFLISSSIQEIFTKLVRKFIRNFDPRANFSRHA